MAKVEDIINGWGSYLVSDKTTTKIAKQRAEICSSCDMPIKGTFEIFLPDFEIKEIQGLKCSVCNCPLSTATRSKNYNCPLGKW
jgi:predicted RNA-binding Zn-ribbon protein involved in translation (DUF1610 family)